MLKSLVKRRRIQRKNEDKYYIAYFAVSGADTVVGYDDSRYKDSSARFKRSVGKKSAELNQARMVLGLYVRKREED